MIGIGDSASLTILPKEADNLIPLPLRVKNNTNETTPIPINWNMVAAKLISSLGKGNLAGKKHLNRISRPPTHKTIF